MTFSPLPNLPTELQLKIWKNAPPDPQIIKLENLYDEVKSPNKITFNTNADLSSFFGASKQSREIALKVLLLCIDINNSSGGKIRLDGVHDKILL